jgi:hypothetical protein
MMAANKWLFRGSGAYAPFFQAANLSDQFVKHLSLDFAGVFPDARELQIAQRGVPQLLRCSPKQHCASDGPGGIEGEDNN